MSAPERVGVIAARLLANLAAPPDRRPSPPPTTPPAKETEMTTHTRTHVFVTFADPHLTCDQCGQPVPAWHNPDQCGCGETGFQNRPCGHQAGITSTCPSWGPVDGCRCLEVFGRVDHAPAEEQR